MVGVVDDEQATRPHGRSGSKDASPPAPAIHEDHIPRRAIRNTRDVELDPRVLIGVRGQKPQLPSIAGSPCHSIIELQRPVRDERLSESWSTTVADARGTIDAWRLDDHTQRPHSSLGDHTPDEFEQFITNRASERSSRYWPRRPSIASPGAHFVEITGQSFRADHTKQLSAEWCTFETFIASRPLNDSMNASSMVTRNWPERWSRFHRCPSQPRAMWPKTRSDDSAR